jgi:hypothetical protein
MRSKLSEIGQLKLSVVQKKKLASVCRLKLQLSICQSMLCSISSLASRNRITHFYSNLPAAKSWEITETMSVASFKRYFASQQC